MLEAGRLTIHSSVKLPETVVLQLIPAEGGQDARVGYP